MKGSVLNIIKIPPLPFLSLLLSLLLQLAINVPTFAESKPVWIDVRSAVEHTFSHIDGDIRISHTDIVPEISKLYPDKNTEIRLYCASGVRSGKAMNALLAAGYTRVSNAGGIDDARKERKLLQE